MGCCGSSSAANADAKVGAGKSTVKGDGTEDAVGENLDENKGLMQSLKERSVIDMINTAGIEKGRKTSIGSNTDQGKTSFANKTIQQIGDEIDLASLGIGYTCRKGLKPEAPNQDSWCMLKTDTISIYGVFDGHGQKGHDISQFVKDNLPKLVVKDPRFKTPDMPAMLKESFWKMQSLISTQDRMKQLSAQMSGTTATICVHDHVLNKITVSHVADSTCVLGKVRNNGGKKEVEGIQLTRDHKPNLKDERARIEKNGGRVVFDGYANHRIYAKNARYPGLNMSRCLGDLMGHQDCGISCEPEVTERDIVDEDQFLLLCSDGVWEFITPLEAVTLVSDFPRAKAMVAAERLAKEAWDRWMSEEGGAVVDDITCLVIHLQGTDKK